MIRISGVLDFSTVVKLWQDSLPQLEASPTLHFDLEKVTASNSAGLALLLEWVKYAKQTGKPIKFSNIPAQLKSLIEVAGMGSSLG